MKPCVPDKLPINTINWKPLIPLIGASNRALAYFDGVLYGITNPDVLLSPLTTQEAVLSSRIEGTQATLGEVLKFEAGETPATFYQCSYISPDSCAPINRFQFPSPVGNVAGLAFFKVSLYIIDTISLEYLS